MIVGEGRIDEPLESNALVVAAGHAFGRFRLLATEQSRLLQLDFGLG